MTNTLSMDKKMEALLIDGNGTADLGVIRSLGRKGIPVTVITDNPRSNLLFSKYCARKIILDPFSEDQGALTSYLINIGGSFPQKPVIFCTSDRDVLMVSRNREILGKYYRFTISGPDVIENLVHKKRFHILMDKYNFPVPKTFLPENIDHLKDHINNFTFPVVLKPSKTAHWRVQPLQSVVNYKKAVKAFTPGELLEWYSKIARYNDDLIIQEFIEGDDSDHYSLHIYMDNYYNQVAFFTGRKIRTYPIHAGIGCFVKGDWQPEIAELGADLLRQIQYRGVALVQFKRNVRKNIFEILEINTRFSSWNGLALECGVNLPYIYYMDTLGNEYEKQDRQRDGSWIYMKNDFLAFLDYRKCGELSLTDWLKSLMGPMAYHTFAKDDPGPLFQSFRNFVRNRIRVFFLK